MTPFDDCYNGKLIEYNRNIRFHHETRHPRQIQHDREMGIHPYLCSIPVIPVIAGNRNVDSLTPEEREYADYYEIGYENHGEKATGGMEGPAELPDAADGERGGCCCCGWSFLKFLRGIRDAVMRRNR